jgi:hypothetical protein
MYSQTKLSVWLPKNLTLVDTLQSKLLLKGHIDHI